VCRYLHGATLTAADKALYHLSAVMMGNLFIYRDLALAALPLAVEKGARAHDQSQAVRHLIAQYK
jgi:hypothetical protein